MSDLRKPGRLLRQRAADRDEVELAALKPRMQLVQRGGLGALARTGFVDVAGQADGADRDGDDARERLCRAVDSDEFGQPASFRSLRNSGEAGSPNFGCKRRTITGKPEVQRERDVLYRTWGSRPPYYERTDCVNEMRAASTNFS